MDFGEKIISFLYHLPLYAIILGMILWVFIWMGIMLGLSIQTEQRITRCIYLILNWALLIMGLYAILRMTMINRKPYTVMYEFHPFSILWGIKKPADYWQVMLLNVLLFFPMGTALPYCLKQIMKKPVIMSIIFILLLSIFIELTQLVFNTGVFETDDIICNTVGGALGTLSYILYIRLLKRKDSTTAL